MGELLTRALGRHATDDQENEQTIVNITYATSCDHGEDEVIRNGVRVDDPVEAARIVAEVGRGDGFPRGKSGKMYASETNGATD